MTIGIDIRVLGSGKKSGIEEYTEQLLAHMLPLDPSIQYKLFYNSFRNSLPDYPWLKLPNVKVVRYWIPNRILFYASLLLNGPKIDKLLGGVDVFFAPHFFLAPLSKGCRRVTTFHDLSYLRFPEFFSWRKRMWHRFEMQPSWQARFSDRLIAVSDSTKKDLSDLYHIDPARIASIYSGVASSMIRPEHDRIERFRQDKHLPQKYVLYMGTLEPRKNIVGIIRAFNLLKEHLEFKDLNLVIAGSRGWLDDPIIFEVKKSPHHRDIHIIGVVKDEERQYYYAAAAIFLYPSFFEGFGFPPLEAMACGTPVVTSHNSSLPEVAGDAALLVDPHSIGDIAAALRSILTHPKLREHMIERGFIRAREFSWRQSAQKTLEVLATS
jgi:glycosyltransferase involved in cell wall biosynthesis